MQINERSLEIIREFDDKIFHILGCGAIGSSAATQLARMGAMQFVLYDLDKVEIQNVGVSYYIYQDIKKPKVVALHEHLTNINPEIRAHEKFGIFTEFIKPLGEGDIVVLGFDSMDSRLEAAEAALKRPNKPYLLIDGRMGAEEYHQFTFKNPTLKQYIDTCYSDANAED